MSYCLVMYYNMHAHSSFPRCCWVSTRRVNQGGYCISPFISTVVSAPGGSHARWRQPEHVTWTLEVSLPCHTHIYTPITLRGDISSCQLMVDAGIVLMCVLPTLVTSHRHYSRMFQNSTYFVRFPSLCLWWWWWWWWEGSWLFFVSIFGFNERKARRRLSV